MGCKFITFRSPHEIIHRVLFKRYTSTLSVLKYIRLVRYIGASREGATGAIAPPLDYNLFKLTIN